MTLFPSKLHPITPVITKIKDIVNLYATYWNSPGFATLRGKFVTTKTVGVWLRGKTELSSNQVNAFMKTEDVNHELYVMVVQALLGDY